MFEAHFGLTGSPFQLRPDPVAYVETRGHGRVMSYLKYGAYQGEGFVVVTGDIGAGKTMLVRSLLRQLDARCIVAAQLVSTQLPADELLLAVASAFGVPPHVEHKAQTLKRLEVFFGALVARGQRALLVVDEAQNLGRGALEELRMLSNFQSDSTPLLQSFLVGQPELRRVLQDPSMAQLRQRVIASCHLGALDAAETRVYVEQRLRRVGWMERPRIEEQAFTRIHARSGGIPRRINLLCSRLLLAAYLSRIDVIAADDVDPVAAEFEVELSHGLADPAAAVPEPAP